MNNSLSGSLRDVTRIRKFKRRRVSSYDRSGANLDSFYLPPGEKRIIFDIDGPACITHIWTTWMARKIPNCLRGLIIRIWWDNEEEPSVECPLGDFFGMGHSQTKSFVSAPLQMSPMMGRAMNSWWAMPFRKHGKIEIENDNPPGSLKGRDGQPDGGVILYFYVDYEEYDEFPEDPENPTGYLHAQFRRVDYKVDMERDPDTNKKYTKNEWQVDAGHNTRENGGYDRNHIIMEGKGRGQYVGCHLNIDNRTRFLINWPGEGDDMIWIDDDIGGEPTLYGTGTEDYVNTAWGPWTKYSAPYHGIIKGGAFNYRGKITYYRYHIQDPVSFEKEILVTIEHGHNNHRGDIWETTAYWYQLEPHMKFPELPVRKERIPRKEKSKIYDFIFKNFGKLAILGGLILLFLKIFDFINWI